MLSIFGERERPNYSAIRLDSLCYLRCFLLILCAQDISTDVLIVMHEKNKTESSLYTCIQSTLLGMHGAERRDRRVSLSLVVSVARRPLLYSCIWLARMAKGKGYKCRVGASLHFLPSYAVSTAGRFLTLSLAIVLHGWCRCTVPSASIESA